MVSYYQLTFNCIILQANCCLILNLPLTCYAETNSVGVLVPNSDLCSKHKLNYLANEETFGHNCTYVHMQYLQFMFTSSRHISTGGWRRLCLVMGPSFIDFGTLDIS